jgi:hypothetical protein
MVYADIAKEKRHTVSFQKLFVFFIENSRRICKTKSPHTNTDKYRDWATCVNIRVIHDL